MSERIARIEGPCVKCPDRIMAGEPITPEEDGWAHVRCKQAAPPTQEATGPLNPEICLSCGLPHAGAECDRPAVGDYPARAAEIRTLMGWSEEGEPFVTTPFRERFGLPPRTEGQLRAMAREQVAESRAGRLVTVGHEDGYEIRQAREQDAGHDADAPAGG